MALAAPFLVESPRWLLQRGRSADAAKARLRLGLPLQEDGEGGDCDAGTTDDGDHAEDEIGDTATLIGLEGGSSGTASMGDGGPVTNRSIISVWNDPRLRVPLLVVTGLLVGQQFSGINAVFYYSTGNTAHCKCCLFLTF